MHYTRPAGTRAARGTNQFVYGCTRGPGGTGMRFGVVQPERPGTGVCLCVRMCVVNKTQKRRKVAPGPTAGMPLCPAELLRDTRCAPEETYAART